MKQNFVIRSTKSFIAIAFPWLTMLMDDNPAAALIALILQATVIGWIPASIWAWKVAHKDNREEKVSESKTLE